MRLSLLFASFLVIAGCQRGVLVSGTDASGQTRADGSVVEEDAAPGSDVCHACQPDDTGTASDTGCTGPGCTDVAPGECQSDDHCTEGSAPLCEASTGNCRACPSVDLLNANFRDETVPDGTTFKPGETFTKSWTLENTGTTPWAADCGFAFEHVSGPSLSNQTSVAPDDLERVAAGGKKDWKVPMTAPMQTGTYKSYWRMTHNGKQFGDKVWVQIRVETDSGCGKGSKPSSYAWPTPRTSGLCQDFKNPIQYQTCGWHTGTDHCGSSGDPILSMAKGKVVHVGPMWLKGEGQGRGPYTVIVRHADGFYSTYGHNKKALVSEGDCVGKGDKIALMGNKGYSSGPHLHFEVLDNTSFTGNWREPFKNACNHYVDPMDYTSP